MPAAEWCRARSRQATKKRGRPDRALTAGSLRIWSPASIDAWRPKRESSSVSRVQRQSHVLVKAEVLPPRTIPLWWEARSQPAIPADPMALCRWSSHPRRTTAAGRLLQLAPLSAGAPRAQNRNRVREIRLGTSCARNRRRSISCTGCKARPSGCRSSVRSRRSRLGPHRWIGAKPPLSSASTKAALATIEEWQLSGDTEARPANRSVCG
jgi:hypothetical protein